ncbi:hypothetical protein [uncultured Shimia sp.]|uniref:hypothetical protein n=1 Tax=uncultured Shimia sp. TaxID=573152 RepID=UPI0026336558|nr:hypothetical protein [uncultured Shimia sp.]
MRFLIPLLIAAAPALADAPVVEDVRASQSGNSWRFDVTLSHPDTGWDHYADGWQVELPSGKVLGFRELLHPHVNEQPFTRSLSGVAIPADAKILHIRARDNVDGWAEDVFILQLD